MFTDKMSLSPAAVAAHRLLAAASHSSHEGGARTWKILTIVLAIPGVGICMANAYMKAQAHSHGQPEFVPYSHLRIRTKRFPWGDGDHTLFHNSHTNALPKGYESSDH
ncbi:cytochrome c oxidase subunit 6A, mitochondrial-like isoform X1 [Girardinichthys multiradiatus]|uniref:cytochrome c oxidase subunit 6A, mitochondrial-like isoform X1 n=2 Tax=Girardinichthys multiradiatus TaxID=208333 RepID=UPI001FACAB9A|nr:cytochrome c oxidase subunit 6A, mitochondrial-like isoform X1 [Girardinichthys multiradiatus]XP_047214963.1 cytochrome c oxidase subunit 6A, mitochondrial-like isoform X1 [Girardinichthys multiradiatus]